MSMQLHHTLMSQYKHGTACGTGSVSYESVANCVTPEIVIYGKCVQNGTPTPDAPVDIIPNNNVYSVNGSYYSIPTLYGVGNVRDEYYPLTGKIVRRCKKLVFNTLKYTSASVYTVSGRNGISLGDVLDGKHVSDIGICSHENVIGFDNTSPRIMRFGANNNYIYWIGILDALGMTTLDEFRTWVDEQNAAGTPLTFVYPLLVPVIEYVDPVQITSVRGTNTIEGTDLNSNMFGIPFVDGTQIDVKYLTHS